MLEGMLNNPLFQGGAGLAVVGGGLAALRTIPSRLWGMTRRRLYLECQVENSDSVYFWLSLWLSLRPEVKNAGVVRVRTHTYQLDSDSEIEEDETRTTSFEPGDGLHVLKYQGKRFLFSVSTENSDNTGQLEKRRSILIRCRRRHRALLQALFQEVIELQRNPTPNHTKIHVPDGAYWNLHTTRPKRDFESVILDDEQRQWLLRDVQAFLDQRDRYTRLGVPYRRGYLLYGPPGNGKSSLALALAGHFNQDLYVLPLGDTYMTDDRLMKLMGKVPGRGIVVVEDVDTVFRKRERSADNKLTLSGVLNALDGLVASEGRVLLMTTNHPEHLDPALIRPGRADVHVELKNASPAQASTLFRRFYETEDHVEEFVAWAGDGTRSMALLQAHLTHHIDDPRTAATTIPVPEVYEEQKELPPPPEPEPEPLPGRPWRGGRSLREQIARARRAR